MLAIPVVASIDTEAEPRTPLERVATNAIQYEPNRLDQDLLGYLYSGAALV
jgi:hypothetical protein